MWWLVPGVVLLWVLLLTWPSRGGPTRLRPSRRLRDDEQDVIRSVLTRRRR